MTSLARGRRALVACVVVAGGLNGLGAEARAAGAQERAPGAAVPEPAPAPPATAVPPAREAPPGPATPPGAGAAASVPGASPPQPGPAAPRPDAASSQPGAAAPESAPVTPQPSPATPQSGAVVPQPPAGPAAIIVVAAPQPTEANPLPARKGVELGLRLGLAHPGGHLGSGSVSTTPTVGEVASTWFPIIADAGYRFSPYFYLGASILWGPTRGDAGDLCVGCGFDFQALTDIRYLMLPSKTFDPWLSVGFGWEVLYIGLGSGPPGASATYSGPVIADLQFGVDVRTKAFALGPYGGVALAEYTTRSLSPEPPGEPSFGSRSVHEWFTFGLRGSYGPW